MRTTSHAAAGERHRQRYNDNLSFGNSNNNIITTIIPGWVGLTGCVLYGHCEYVDVWGATSYVHSVSCFACLARSLVHI